MTIDLAHLEQLAPDDHNYVQVSRDDLLALLRRLRAAERVVMAVRHERGAEYKTGRMDWEEIGSALRAYDKEVGGCN